jgi:hypothetical protein
MPPDETATPATETSEGSRGSEFSKPTGAGDDALWAKHFGADAKESTSSKSSSKSESDGKPAAGKSKTSESGKAASGKSPEPTKSKAEPSSSSPKESKSPKKDDASAATGQKTADKDPDPEAPSRKARDLYEQAEKTEDRKEARKLYKKALVEAFGKVPPEFDDKRYVAVRTERAAAQKVIDEKAAKVESRIVEAKTKLQPAIYVMRKLEDSGLADKLSVPFVEQAVRVMKAIKAIEGGDFTQLAEAISLASGVDHDEAMKRFVRGVKVSPEGKASREAAARAEARAAAAEARIQEMERRLSEEKTTQTAEQTKAEQARKAEAHRAQYLEDMTAELDGHPVLQLPNGAKRVLAYLIRTATPNKSARYSFEEAANRVVAHEKKRVESARFLVEGDPPPARSEPRQIRSVSRTETADASVRSADPIERFNDIFDKHAPKQRRAR